jgi:hypothetical protein
MRLSILLFICCSVNSLLAQVFTEVSLSQGIVFSYAGGEYGGGVSFVDFNKDGWDDLSFCQNGTSAPFYTNNQGDFGNAEFFFSNFGELKQILWVDYDNDNDLDIFATRMWDVSSLYENDGNMNFTDVTIESGIYSSEEFMTFGASFGDYDRDGDLDLYLTNYNGPGFNYPTITNYLYQNNGDGTFSDVTAFAGVSNGSCYSFNGLWLDYNKDFWPDLLVINDRTSCDNYLYHNNGDGTFTDVSIQSGIGNNFIFSMNNVGDDYDNDGDLDVYVTNNPSGNLLYKNNGNGTFTESATQAGVKVFDHTWAAHFFDYDNDSHQDLHVSCSPFWGNPGQNKFFKNNGDGTFTNHIAQAGFTGDVGFSHSSAIGDINNDGHFDIVIVKDSPTLSRLYQGPTTSNHWLKVKPEGIVSNKDGVGTWIECYVADKQYVRYTYCGEGYMSQNSQSEIFGLGEYAMIDSLVARWTSGIVDTWYNVQADQYLTLVEGSSLAASINSNGIDGVCHGDFVTLSVPGFDQVLWNDGTNSETLDVYQSGEYWCSVVSSNGIIIHTDTIEISVHPLPLWTIETEDVTCFGAHNGLISINSENEENETIIWSNPEWTGFTLENVGPGNYSFEVTNENTCTSGGELAINQPSALESTISVQHNLCFGESEGVASLEITGGTSPYTINWSQSDGLGLADGLYSVEVIDAQNCEVNHEFEVTSPSEIIPEISFTESSLAFGPGTAQASASGGTPTYSFFWSNNQTGEFVENLEAGFYSCVVTDSNGCSEEVVFEILFNDIRDTYQRDDLIIYPNPFWSELNIACSSDVSSLSIYSGLGQKLSVFTRPKTNPNWQIDLKFLPSGNYFVVGGSVDNKMVFIKKITKATN